MSYIEQRSVRRSPFLSWAYWLARRRFGRVPTSLGIMAHSRRVLLGTVAFELTTEKATAISPRLKELAVLKSATIIGCRFCIDLGASLARQRGLSDADFLALSDPETDTHFDDVEKAVLKYADLMTQTPLRIPRPLLDHLQRSLGDEGLVELTASVAWENYRARFNHAFGITEQGYSDPSLCLLAPRPAQSQLPGKISHVV